MLAGLQTEMSFEKWKFLNECLFTDYLSPTTVIVGALTFTTGHHRPNYTTAAIMAARHSCSHSNHTLPHPLTPNPLFSCYPTMLPWRLTFTLDWPSQQLCVCFRSVGWCSHAAYTEGLSWILIESYHQAPQHHPASWPREQRCLLNTQPWPLTPPDRWTLRSNPAWTLLDPSAPLPWLGCMHSPPPLSKTGPMKKRWFGILVLFFSVVSLLLFM